MKRQKIKNATPLKIQFKTWAGATGVVGWCEATDHNPVNRINSNRVDANKGGVWWLKARMVQSMAGFGVYLCGKRGNTLNVGIKLLL